MARHYKKKNTIGFDYDENVYLDVSVHEDHLNNTGRYVGKVQQKTVGIENLIACIKQHNIGLSENTIYFVSQLISNEILSELHKGHAVDVLGLGKLYLSVSGSIASQSDTSSLIPKFKLEFTPSKVATDSVKNIKANDLLPAKSEPSILSVVGLNGGIEVPVSVGCICKIKGDNIKLMGLDSTVCFTPLDKQDKNDTSQDIVLTSEDIVLNKPKELVFLTPKTLVAQRPYNVSISTRWNKSGIERKIPVKSNKFTVVFD